MESAAALATVTEVGFWILAAGIISLLVLLALFIPAFVLTFVCSSKWLERTVLALINGLLASMGLFLMGLGVFAWSMLLQGWEDKAFHLNTSRSGNGMIHVYWQDSPFYFSALCVLYAAFGSYCIFQPMKMAMAKIRVIQSRK